MLEVLIFEPGHYWRKTNANSSSSDTSDAGYQRPKYDKYTMLSDTPAEYHKCGGFEQLVARRGNKSISEEPRQQHM